MHLATAETKRKVCSASASNASANNKSLHLPLFFIHRALRCLVVWCKENYFLVLHMFDSMAQVTPHFFILSTAGYVHLLTSSDQYSYRQIVFFFVSSVASGLQSHPRMMPFNGCLCFSVHENFACFLHLTSHEHHSTRAQQTKNNMCGACNGMMRCDKLMLPSFLYTSFS